MVSVVAALGSNRQPVEIGRTRMDRQIRELTLEHAGGSLGDEAYLARLRCSASSGTQWCNERARRLPAEKAD